jgi:hypothetical protein
MIRTLSVALFFFLFIASQFSPSFLFEHVVKKFVPYQDNKTMVVDKSTNNHKEVYPVNKEVSKADENKPNEVSKVEGPKVEASKIVTSKRPLRGIYLTQYTVENTALLNHLIKRAKASGINTFVIDFDRPSKRYRKNISLVKENNIHYVARIVMFPDGGTPKQILDPNVWQKKYDLVKQAVEIGANQIQLDYIRYNTKQRPSEENAKDIHKIIHWYKNKLSGQNIPLQVDVFGVTSFGESKYIGQNIKLFSQSVDAICPMVYPSHYDPYPLHFRKPYETVHDSLVSIKQQFNNKMPIKMYAYIELSNYHFPMSSAKKIDYIKAQIKAVEAAKADGWFAWSPHNRYDHLFSILENKMGKKQK